MTITDEKYVLLTTYRRSGEAVAAPVWIVPLDDGRAGFWTAMGTGKTKRLKNDSRITLQPCDARGKVAAGATTVTGTAQLVQSGADFDLVQQRVKAKYGVMTKVTKLLAKLGPQGRKGLTYADTVVLMTLVGG